MATESVADAETITLDASQRDDIRRALIIGLATYGQLEEKLNSYEIAKNLGQRWPREARPEHPTGATDVVSIFATALAFVR